MPGKFTLYVISLTAVGLLATLRFGFPAALTTLLILLPSLAWRYDNHTGSLFMIAMLFAVVIAILFLLMGMLAFVAGSI